MLTRIGILCFLAFASTGVIAQTAIRINFAPNSISHEWRGIIANRGYQDFVLRLGKGQQFQVGGGDIYTWSVTDPRGKRLGCDNQSSCSPGQSMFLQMAGDYIVHTYFRMDSGVNQPIATTRRVHLLFVAH